MTMTPSDIALGMDVHSSDGEKVGTVNEIAATVSGEGYILVEEGGFLGFDASQLWVPLTAVARVEDGRHVTLSCSKSQAIEQYKTKPKSLGHEF